MEYGRDTCRPLLSPPALQSPAIKTPSKRPSLPGGGIRAKPEVPGCRLDSGPVSPGTVPRLRLICPNLHHRLGVTRGLASW